jgi:hypothetical protein
VPYAPLWLKKKGVKIAKEKSLSTLRLYDTEYLVVIPA